uniref:Uncharacterized protein n=1 Tax=Glossina austeni TaxID=7395 RepID=A0A1A9VLS6_GLOAU
MFLMTTTRLHSFNNNNIKLLFQNCTLILQLYRALTHWFMITQRVLSKNHTRSLLKFRFIIRDPFFRGTLPKTLKEREFKDLTFRCSLNAFHILLNINASKYYENTTEAFLSNFQMLFNSKLKGERNLFSTKILSNLALNTSRVRVSRFTKALKASY